LETFFGDVTAGYGGVEVVLEHDVFQGWGLFDDDTTRIDDATVTEAFAVGVIERTDAVALDDPDVVFGGAGDELGAVVVDFAQGALEGMWSISKRKPGLPACTWR